MRYLRIPSNKFWGWVVVSALFGLALGLAAMLWNGAAATSRIASLEARLSGAGIDSSATAGAAEQRAASAEATVAALTEQVAQLSAQLQTANDTIASLQGAAAPTTDTGTGTLTISSRTVTPASVSTSGTITLTVKVAGSAEKVQMRLLGLTGQGFDITYNLKKVSTSGGTETWRKVMAAPSKTGTYRYYASAFVGGVRTTMPGTSGWTFEVK